MNSGELNWQDMRLFLAVAEQGSFSGAARELKLGQPTLSRRIAELEEQLGQKLFSRISQGCELTELGAKLLPAAQQMAVWSTEALTQVQSPNKIEGRVRLTAPPGVAFAMLPQAAVELKKAYPDIRLEVLSGIDTLNLARGEADISLRTQVPEDEDLICLASFYRRLKVFVSPALAESLSDAVSIQDVDWICWPDGYDYLQINQFLKRDIPDFKPAFTANDYNVQLAACSAGLGALVLPEGFEKSTSITGLTPLQIDLSQYAPGELHIVVHKRQRYIQRVVKVTDILNAYFQSISP